MKTTLFLLSSLLTLQVSPVQTGTTNRPSFDVATVKLDTSGEPGRRFAPMPSGRLVVTRHTLRMLISAAYGNQNLQFPDGPSWVDTDLWDIEAKAPEGTIFAVGPGADPVKSALPGLMLQSLLAERFQLKLHHETQQLPVYELSVAKGGLKMKLSADQSPPAPLDPNAPRPQPGAMLPRGIMHFSPGSIGGTAMPISQALLPLLSGQAGRPIIDKTGLLGLYDIELHWTPEPLARNGPTAIGGVAATTTTESADPDSITIFTAIQDQLGMKLDAAKGPVDVLVIDSVQRPH
jgi:uncharacterized protein (TIGR03435 family)